MWESEGRDRNKLALVSYKVDIRLSRTSLNPGENSTFMLFLIIYNIVTSIGTTIYTFKTPA